MENVWLIPSGIAAAIALLFFLLFNDNKSSKNQSLMMKRRDIIKTIAAGRSRFSSISKLQASMHDTDTKQNYAQGQCEPFGFAGGPMVFKTGWTCVVAKIGMKAIDLVGPERMEYFERAGTRFIHV